MRREVKVGYGVVALASLFMASAIAPSAQAVEKSAQISRAFFPKSFYSNIKSPFLNNAGVVIKDVKTGRTVYSNGANVLRAPASVLKLISTTSSLETLGADTTFSTHIYGTSTPGHFVMLGDSDPWVAFNSLEVNKYHRAFLPSLVNEALKQPGVGSSITIDYAGVYQSDIQTLVKYFAPRITITANKLSSAGAADATKGAEISSITSPNVAAIIQFTLLWSDNVLADRLARTSAIKLGLGGDAPGLNKLFTTVLDKLGVTHTGLEVFDGNGLSHDTRVSASTIEQLLIKIKSTPELDVIYKGLPTSGKTGTLQNRFVTDAPAAVNLIHAKTGWINTTVSLAGFVKAGQKDYVFTIIDNHVKNSEYYRGLARIAIDKALAAIAHK
jgi:D-alanyl-D-alanine carboxypeptidase